MFFLEAKIFNNQKMMIIYREHNMRYLKSERIPTCECVFVLREKDAVLLHKCGSFTLQRVILLSSGWLAVV